MPSAAVKYAFCAVVPAVHCVVRLAMVRSVLPGS